MGVSNETATTENVEPLAGGKQHTIGAAVAAATDALVVAARARGRQEYRITLADTSVIVVPGLTAAVGGIDLCALRGALDMIRP